MLLHLRSQRSLCGGLSTYAYVNGTPLTLIDPFGLDPGDKFKSIDDAAVDAGNWARKRKFERIEYGGWIYQEGKCYVYDANGIGSGGSARPGPKPPNAVAAWHTHPLRNPGDDFPDDEEFSFTDENGNGDEAWIKYWKKPLYLRSPRGDDKVWSPSKPARKLPKRPPEKCDCP